MADFLFKVVLSFLFNHVLLAVGRAMVWLLTLGHWQCEQRQVRDGLAPEQGNWLSRQAQGQREVSITGQYLLGLLTVVGLLALPFVLL